MMYSQKIVAILALALLTKDSHGFTAAPSAKSPIYRGSSIVFSASTDNSGEETATIVKEITQEVEQETENKAEKPKEDKKTENKNKKDGIFTPVVKTVRAVVGEENFKELKYKGIEMHSGVIKDFVNTSDSEFGTFVLKQLFAAADKDNNGTIELEELEDALKRLGFDFLKENQVKSIFKRADTDKNGCLDRDEFMKVAPKTLQQNLVKLAKNNGGDLGLLS